MSDCADISVFCAHTELVAIDQLVENPRNPNKHPESQIELLAKIIKSQGFRNPIVVSKRSGFVTKGHGRLAAARLLQMQRVPVDFQDYESEAAEWADMIADNRIAELAETSQEELKQLLSELDGQIDLELTGFDEDALDDILDRLEINENPAEDIPEPPEEPITKSGDLFELGEHRLLCGDSTNAEDVIRLMQGERAILFATDPPYLVGYDDNNHPGQAKGPAEQNWDELNADEKKDLYNRFIQVAVEHAMEPNAAWYCWKQAMVEEA